MLKLLLGLVLAAFVTSASAQTSFTAKDAAGVTRTFTSFNCSSTICSLSVPADTAGAAFGVVANPFYTTQIPVTAGGLTNYVVQPTASDNHVVIKAGAGQVYKIVITNNSATVNYIRLYNATTGFNGCNSATNLIYANAIPASASVGGLVDNWPQGLAFSTGISICVTSGYAWTDTTNATASAMNVNIGYK